ncbi:MAG TPA: EAL domain-containing protein [Gammaproteobacteria bacterium]|nr:EAL domain-containing protein [Gammaproteobacteria bacterium]
MERTLLLVDDEPNVTRALKRLLYPGGYQILSANSGAEGLTLLDQHNVNVIISDQRMPDMTGVEFLSQVRERWPDTVRIVLSAYADFKAVTGAINDGAIYKFFTKPWDNGLMRANVREAFQHSELNWRNEQLTRIFESTLEGIMITDANGVIQSVNPAFSLITGYSAAEAIGNTPRLMRSGRHDAEFYQQMWQSLDDSGQWQGEIWNRRKNGEIYPQWMVLTAITIAGGRPGQYVALFNDISEQKRNEERIRHQAYHDALTGLPNRLLFNDRLEQALAQARRANEKLAVMFIDLDRFKNINDSLGHAVGDQLLRGMSQRLAQCTRDEDSVARMGGDEFTVLLPRIQQLDDIEQVARKILHSLSQPLAVEGHELAVTASIGISLFPSDGDRPDILMKNADSAMYWAKEQGKNKHQFYNADMSAGAVEHLALEAQLRRALEREEFLLHFQPQIALHDERLIGFEVLVRWQHPELGLVPPGKFIALLEETGLISPVGEWILHAACRQNQTWREQGLTPVRVAVNFSAHQFRNADPAVLVEQALRNTALPAGGLEVEITEGVLMDDIERSINTLRRLRERGVTIAIDDFGTGYSSLSYLKQFPADSLKIDQSFVRDITCNPQDREIVTSIITMAHALGLTVIAEGVETRGQLKLLRKLHCDQIQGYLIDRPLPVTQATEVLARAGTEDPKHASEQGTQT